MMMSPNLVRLAGVAGGMGAGAGIVRAVDAPAERRDTTRAYSLATAGHLSIAYGTSKASSLVAGPRPLQAAASGALLGVSVMSTVATVLTGGRTLASRAD